MMLGNKLNLLVRLRHVNGNDEYQTNNLSKCGRVTNDVTSMINYEGT